MSKSEIEYIISPKTGRQISVGGPAWKKLLEDGYFEEELRSRTTFRGSPRGKTHSESAPGRKWIEEVKNLPVRKSKGEMFTQRGDEAPHLKRRIASYKSQDESRGSRTRGWGIDAPRRGRERHLLLEKCGDRCFLIPEKESFPICTRCQSETECNCQLDCRGLNAAKIRAHQWKYENLYDTIDQLEREYCRSGAN